MPEESHTLSQQDFEARVCAFVICEGGGVYIGPVFPLHQVPLASFLLRVEYERETTRAEAMDAAAGVCSAVAVGSLPPLCCNVTL